jgi:REP element-mobilizing transposase RayT
MKYLFLHIVARGVRRGSLFETQQDFELFISLVKRFAPPLGIKVVAYCLMDNHYHLFIWCPDDMVTTFLHRLNRTYAEAFNLSTGRCGHVFEERGRAFEKWGPTILPCVVVYILLNPLKARMVTHPRDFEFSSYRFNSGEAPLPDWMDDSELLRCFSPDLRKGRRIFKDFLESFIDDIPTLQMATDHWLKSNGEGHRSKTRIHAVEFATLTAIAMARCPTLHELETTYQIDEIDLTILAITEVMTASNSIIASALWAVYKMDYSRQAVGKRRRALVTKFAQSPQLHRAMVDLAEGALLFVPRPTVSIGTE